MLIYNKKPITQRARQMWVYFEQLHPEKQLISVWFKKNRKKFLHMSGWWFAMYDDETLEIKLPTDV